MDIKKITHELMTERVCERVRHGLVLRSWTDDVIDDVVRYFSKWLGLRIETKGADAGNIKIVSEEKDWGTSLAVALSADTIEATEKRTDIQRLCLALISIIDRQEGEIVGLENALKTNSVEMHSLRDILLSCSDKWPAEIRNELNKATHMTIFEDANSMTDEDDD